MSGNSSVDNVSDPGDPCNSYEWSVVFCFIMTLSIIAWLVAIAVVSIIIYSPPPTLSYLSTQILSSRQSRGSSPSGLDKLSALLFLATIIQFGPMLSSSLHSGHNYYYYSQTGCKMLFYTEYGARHVITVLVVGMVAYAYYGLHHGFESVSGRMGTAGLGWILLGLAGVQGLFGMVPAM